MYKLENNKILFYGDVINFELLPYLGFGSIGDIYKFNIGNETFALKVFNDVLFNRDEADYYLHEYERLQKINIDSYVSPLKLLFINDKFNGYLMRYCKGKDLDKRRLNITLKSLYKSIKKLYNDTNKLSEANYIIDDLHSANIMYDNGFKLIDMDDYLYDNTSSLSHRKIKNFIRLNNLLLDIFFKTTNTRFLFMKQDELSKLQTSCELGEISFEEFIYGVCEFTKKISDEDINKVDDIGKVFRKKFYKN